MSDDITMACGQRAQLDAVCWENAVTFATRYGFLEGSMFNLNRFVIKHMTTAVTAMWQLNRFVLILPNGWIVAEPERYVMYGKGFISERPPPEYLLFFLLRAETPVSEQGEYSQLAAATFLDEVPHPVVDVIKQKAQQLHWKKYAVDETYIY